MLLEHPLLPVRATSHHEKTGVKTVQGDASDDEQTNATPQPGNHVHQTYDSHQLDLSWLGPCH